MSLITRSWMLYWPMMNLMSNTLMQLPMNFNGLIVWEFTDDEGDDSGDEW